MARQTKSQATNVPSAFPSAHPAVAEPLQPKAALLRTKLREKRGALISVMKHALETFGSTQKADHWLNRPNHLLGNKTPLEVMQTDPEQVEAALVRIDHGVYI